MKCKHCFGPVKPSRHKIWHTCTICGRFQKLEKTVVTSARYPESKRDLVVKHGPQHIFNVGMEQIEKGENGT
jgi:hypothetical protein